MKDIKSPISSSPNIKELRRYPKQHFIDLYDRAINIDISKYFESVEEVLYLKCLDTGYKFFYPYTIFADTTFYEQLQHYDWYYHKEKWEFDYALKNINITDRVLEIGAGTGAFLDKLKNPKQLIDAMDFNKQACLILKEKGFQVYSEPIEKFARNNKNKYDVVLFFQVLEHIFNVDSFLKNVTQVLKPGGKLIIAVPNDDALIMKYDHNLCLNFPPHHAGHWNKKSFINLQYYYPIKLESIKDEPLTEPFYRRYYRVLAVHYRKKFGWFGKLIDKVFYPFSYQLVKLFSKQLKGLSVVVIYKKNNI